MKRFFDKAGQEMDSWKVRCNFDGSPEDPSVLVINDDGGSFPAVITERRIAHAASLGGNAAQQLANYMLALSGERPVDPRSRLWTERDIVGLAPMADYATVERVIRNYLVDQGIAAHEAAVRLAIFASSNQARLGDTTGQGPDGRKEGDGEPTWGFGRDRD